MLKKGYFTGIVVGVVGVPVVDVGAVGIKVADADEVANRGTVVSLASSHLESQNHGRLMPLAVLV